MFWKKLSREQSHLSIKNENLNINRCQFENCHSENGGGIFAESCQTIISFCIFQSNSATHGGSLYLTRDILINLTDTTFLNSTADRFGSIYVDGKNKLTNMNLIHTNITISHSKYYIAGIHLEMVIPVFKRCLFSDTISTQYGAIWDWTSKPITSLYQDCAFINTTSNSAGGAFCGFHWMHQSDFINCAFIKVSGTYPTCIYLYSIDSQVTIMNCHFDISKEHAIGSQFEDNIFIIDDSSTFDSF